MVSQTNAAGSSARRRRRSTPTPREQARPRKAIRYPGTANGFICFSFSELDSGLSSDSACYHWDAEFIQGRFSDSDEDKRASSIDSMALTSPTVNAVHDDSSMQLPTRLFAPGYFPTALRLNIYSKANVIGAVASALLIGSLLCRQLITARKYEFWYTFATHPLRFSLDNFHSITVLNCGAFDVEDSDSEEAAELVDGVLCCTNKNLKLTPKYVEMITDVPSFLDYAWGRLSFLYTLSRILPPPLLAFEAVPQLLARIPDAPNTATFLEDPSACATTVIILNTNDILALEAEPDITVHFSLIPVAERHMWSDEISEVERSLFRGRGKQPENAPLPPEDKPEVVPIIQRNLRPRKPAAVVVEDVTSSEHNEPEVPHQLGSSPDKDLKLWHSVQLQNVARGIYERLETMERNICFHLGVSRPNVHNTRKRKADDDSLKTDGIQVQRPPRKSRRTNSTVTKPATKIHSYPQSSADRLQGNIGRTPPYFNKKSRDDNDCEHDRTPPFDEHVNYN
ncbi:hypothetical protein F2Q69_00007656 [Brassica cretica]|uniref:DUF1985 domain-containing protein n=1 Tax=Brassica cretica TaxID=69181 RepID=A0A8S9PEW2_BRACR|nr:hypothetical protein F2Q69_00007656 [Brassica cretica]